MPIQIASVPALLAVLLCAGLFVLLFQYLFPRPAPWKLAGVALVAGIVATFLLAFILRAFAAHGMGSLEALSTVSSVLPFAILRVGLPEEGVKTLGAIVALLPFWRRVTPAQAFQTALFVAIGFAIVENQGYISAFRDHAMLIAFGRGLGATMTHTVLAMIFGTFLMRFAASGWRAWHVLIIGYLVAAGCHALYDLGMLPVAAEFMRTKTVDEETVLNAIPLASSGILFVLVLGFWSLRRAIRRAALEDPIALEPRHQAVVRYWRWSANTLLLLGAVGLIAAVAWTVSAGVQQAETLDPRQAMLTGGSIVGSVFAMIVSWVVRQKR